MYSKQALLLSEHCLRKVEIMFNSYSQVKQPFVVPSDRVLLGDRGELKQKGCLFFKTENMIRINLFVTAPKACFLVLVSILRV